MLVVYNSVTGNVERFIHKTKLNNIVSIKDINSVDENFILVTSTVGFGKIPTQVTRFLNDNHQYLLGVVASGNKNWGINYAKAGDVISKQYNVPLLMKFELAGTESDVERFIKEVKSIGRNTQNS